MDEETVKNLPTEFHNDMKIGDELVIDGKRIRIKNIDVVVEYEILGYKDIQSRGYGTFVFHKTDFKEPFLD